jgi:hypothetical protein
MQRVGEAVGVHSRYLSMDGDLVHIWGCLFRGPRGRGVGDGGEYANYSRYPSDRSISRAVGQNPPRSPFTTGIDGGRADVDR